MSEEKLQILKMVEAGQIDADEAAMLLAAMKEPGAEPEEGAASPTLEPEALPPMASSAAEATFAQEARESRWTRFWIYPLMAGGVVLILGLLVIGLVSTTDAARGWLVCGWLPLLLGLTVVLLALWSRRAAWLHLRISEGGKRKMAFSFPLPLTLTAWAVRIAQPVVPQLRETAVDEVIMALRDSAAHGEPLFIDVEDEEDGERVEIYIG
ncbi:MAG: hypothetical protein P8189_05730 [Anaerolineae bacterium]|jgi:hypothetical protein